MMKVILNVVVTCTLFVLFARNAVGQSNDVKQLLDTTITLLKLHSVNRNSVDWDKIEKKVGMDSRQITDPYKLGPVMRFLLRSLDDFHGYFAYKDSIFNLPYRGPAPSDSVKNQWSRGINLKTEIVADKIGYLRIPYMPYDGKDGVDKKAQSLNDSLCTLLQNNIKGLIIDLRLNGGGAMFPMILGVSALLDTGKIGSFTAGNEVWYIRDNNFLLDTMILTSLRSKCSKARNLPVAVLIGTGTGSSGEFMAIALRSRNRTTFIGSRTAGYVTSIQEFDIAPDAFVHISTGYGADKNNRIYKSSIKPDLQVERPDNFNDLINDSKVKAAIKWLKSH